MTNLDFNNLDLDRLSVSERHEFEILLTEHLTTKVERVIPSFEEFCVKYLSKYFNHAMPTFRKGIIEYLNDSSIQNKKLSVVEPRSHGKSTTYVFGYSIYQLIFGLRNFIVYFGSTKTEARGWLNNIRMEFENNEAIINDFPYMAREVSSKTGQPTSWNDNDLFFKSGQRLSCKGWHNSTRGLNHYGQRPDFILLDDVESEKTIRTPFIRERFFQYYTNAVANLAGAKGCDTFIVGTLLHPESFLARAINSHGSEEFAEFHKSFHRAIIDWNTEEVLWPEVWSFEKLLEKQKEIGERAFAQEFQGIPASMHHQLFSETSIKCYSDQLGNLSDRAGWTRFLYVDPSMGKINGDYSSLCVIYENVKGERFVVDWITSRLGPDELCNAIYNLHLEHHFNGVGFEVNATQGLFINLFKRIYSEKHIKVPFIPINHSLPKKNRIDALEPYINSGKILFNPAWRSKQEYALGLRQLFNYDGRNGDHDDGPDGLAGANELFNMRQGLKHEKGKWTHAH